MIKGGSLVDKKMKGGMYSDAQFKSLTKKERDRQMVWRNIGKKP
jgi:hypothetical protein